MSKVNKFYYDTSIEASCRDDEGPHMIHIENHGMTTLSSLCGHCDRTEWTMVYTDEKPTCKTCLDVWDMIKKGKL